jgi:hypothetical protein
MVVIRCSASRRLVFARRDREDQIPVARALAFLHANARVVVACEGNRVWELHLYGHLRVATDQIARKASPSLKGQCSVNVHLPKLTPVVVDPWEGRGRNDQPSTEKAGNGLRQISGLPSFCSPYSAATSACGKASGLALRLHRQRPERQLAPRISIFGEQPHHTRVSGKCEWK